MRIWKIIPVTPAQDPRWQDHPVWREVIVRAETAAMARLLAGKLDRDPSGAGMGNETPDARSAFDDEKLYWVTDAGPEAIPEGDVNGPAGVLRAEPLARDVPSA